MTVTPQDKRDLDKFIKFLCLKSTQVIVQGRLGKLISTESVHSPSGAEWFNLAIKDYPEIQREAKAAMGGGNPKVDQSLVIEISLRTSDADLLVLEVWSIGLTNKCEDVRVHHTVYNRMALLLKSLLCVSRVTPAYKLSRQQGSEFVICYRVYMGQISLVGLGEGFKTLRVGSVGTPVGTVTMSAAYRTTENLHVSTKGISNTAGSPLQVEADYFSQARPHVSSPARPCTTLKSRHRTLSETSDGLGRSSFENRSSSFNIFKTSLSGSPIRMTEKDGKIATFTLGTPPRYTSAHRSTSSPILARVHRRQTSQPGQCSPSCNHGFHSNNCSKQFGNSLQTGFPQHAVHPGSSAPALQCYYKPGSSPNVASGNPRRTSLSSVPRSSSQKQAGHLVDEHSETGTSNCRWNESRITADGTNKSLDVGKSPPKSVVGGPEGRGSGSPQPPSPPTLATGAFVLGSKTAARAQETLAATGASLLPFSDLLSAIEDDESLNENLSDRSGSDTSPDITVKNCHNNGKSIQGRCSSSSSLSSRQSGGSLNKRGAHDDFVLVDLKPAFGSDDSIGDLGTFYRACENAPELIMFEEQLGTENDETLHDLTKQLEDYENDMTDFDQFICEITTK